jgi:hypothetical protein
MPFLPNSRVHHAHRDENEDLEKYRVQPFQGSPIEHSQVGVPLAGDRHSDQQGDFCHVAGRV